MNQYLSIHLKDCWPYKEVDLEIPRGVSVFYGLNRTHAKSQNANAAGKSFLWSQVGEIQFGVPNLGERSDSVKSGYRALRVKTFRGETVRLQRTDGKFEVINEKTGKSIARTKPLIKQWMAKNLPITQDEFETYVYLDSRVGHRLVMGSATERKNFMVSFFKLDEIDREKKLVLSALREIKTHKTSYNEVRREYDNLKAELSTKRKRDELKELVDTVRTKLEKLKIKQEKTEQHRRRAVFLEASEEQRKELKRALKGATLTEDSFDSIYTIAKDSVSEAADLVDKAKDWEAHRARVSSYKEAIAEIDADLLPLLDDPKLKDRHFKYLDAEEQIKSLKRKLSSRIDSKPKKVLRPVGFDDLNEIIDQRRQLQHQLEHAKKFGKGKCPTCGQEVKTTNPDELQSKIRKLKKKEDEIHAYSAYTVAIEAYRKQEAEFSEMRTALSEAERVAKKFKQYSAAYTLSRNLPDKPSKFNGERIDIAKAKEKYQAAQYRFQCLKFLKPNLDMLIDGSDEAPVDYGPKIQELNDQLNELKVELEVVTTYRKRLKAVKSRLSELKTLMEDEDALQLLYEAYGDKAMKKMAIEAISSHLMAQVNKYARLVFPESYRFEMKWNTRLDLIVHRKYGKRTISSDVRKLSGAEYKLFSIVLVMALLAFVPKSKRASVLILDEPSANMHNETRQAFVEFLDVMTRIIPSVVIITPKSEEIYKGATEFTVVKHDGWSQLVKGRPDQVRTS